MGPFQVQNLKCGDDCMVRQMCDRCSTGKQERNIHISIEMDDKWQIAWGTFN